MGDKHTAVLGSTRATTVAALLAVSCATDSDDGAGSSDATSSTTEATSSTSSTTSTASTTTSDITGDTTSSATTSTSSSTTSMGSTSATTDATGSTGSMHNEACAAGCTVEVMCGDEWSSEDECVQWCEDNLVEAAMFTTFCRDAWENLHACIGTLDCAGYDDYLMGGDSCYEAYFLQQFECEGQ